MHPIRTEKKGEYKYRYYSCDCGKYHKYGVLEGLRCDVSEAGAKGDIGA